MKSHTFQKVDPHVEFPILEEEILAYWKKNNIFEKSIDSRSADNPWTFLDGPPFITGLPHYGTLLSSIPKDIFPRYFTMKGYRVRRVWGWDCHGLPAENKVEKELGIKRKKDIEEKVGVGPFIDACKSYVRNVSGEWEWYVDHIARWVDFTNAYKTMDQPYMETVMWVFHEMYRKGYIYKGLRISLYCPHCSTPISNFEVAMDQENYKEITEPATTYKYELEEELHTYILAWSTTPWNKLATPALAVNPKLEYVKVKQGDECYILAASTLGKLTDTPYTEIERFQGTKLVGKKFKPHYDFYTVEKGNNAFIIIAGDFVTADEGTGVVTIAAYGEEDLALMQKEHIQIVLHVDDEGHLKQHVPKWGGMYYLDVNPLVNEDLRSRGLIYRDESISHTVPTCWRCHTRLIFAPQNAWYVDVQKLKPKLKQTNKGVNWFPEHFKFGRYEKNLDAAPDWCISRSRYWGSPVPVWECTCKERFVPGSIDELSRRAGKPVTDLHKPEIDSIVIVCEKCGKTVHRVPEVLDSWIEAGSAPYAERHFPFNKDIQLDTFFPPDFITEYTGQIRAWFYVLHVIGVALFGSAAFKNVLVTGVILGTDGRKMSKNFGNYPDPKEMLKKYGGDALRLYLMGTTVMHGEDICISEEQYRNQVRGFLLIVWNMYNFFLMYAIADKWSPHRYKSIKQGHVLDKWIHSRGQSTLIEVTDSLDSFDTVAAIKSLEAFVSDFSQWYVRRSRSRINLSATNRDDKDACYQTLFNELVLLSHMLAPIAPFISETIYRNLTGEASVHLALWPKVKKIHINKQLEMDMISVRNVVERIHAKRKELKIPVRQPLGTCHISNVKHPISNELIELIKDETNIREIICNKGEAELDVELDTTLTPELENEGKVRDVIRKIQILRKEKGCSIDTKIDIVLPKELQSFKSKYLDEITSQTLAKGIVWGESYGILTSK